MRMNLACRCHVPMVANPVQPDQGRKLPCLKGASNVDHFNGFDHADYRTALYRIWHNRTVIADPGYLHRVKR